MRGRKKIKEAKNEVFSIRLTKEHKDLLEKNEWIKKEIIELIRTRLDLYSNIKK